MMPGAMPSAIDLRVRGPKRMIRRMFWIQKYPLRFCVVDADNAEDKELHVVVEESPSSTVYLIPVRTKTIERILTSAHPTQPHRERNIQHMLSIR